MAMWSSGAWKIRYITIAARVLSGLPAWQIDRATAFDAVAFYNFIQVTMPTIQVRPTPEQARASWPAFREILAELDPTHIVATGLFLWENMPPSDRGEGVVALGGESLPWCEYAMPSGYARALSLAHLSRASAARWHAPVREFLAA